MITLEMIAVFISVIFIILFTIGFVWRLREAKIKEKKEKALNEEYDIRNLKDITEISEHITSVNEKQEVLNPEINVIVTKDGPIFIDQRSKWYLSLQRVIYISLPILAFLLFIVYFYLKNMLALIWFINTLSQTYELKPEFFKNRKKKRTQ